MDALRNWVLKSCDNMDLIPWDTPDRWEWASTWDVLTPDWEFAVDPHTGGMEQDSEIANKIEEPIPYLYHFPLLSPKYCHWLIQHAESLNKWSVSKTDKYAGLEMDLKKVMWSVYNYHARLVIGVGLQSILSGLFQWQISRVEKVFLIKYNPRKVADMKMHFDDPCRMSVSINLNDGFEGGNLTFVRYPEHPVKLGIGEALLFGGGCPMFQHQAHPVTEGTRYVLVYWMK